MRIKFLYPLVFLLSVSPLIPESLSLYKYNEKYGLINEERKIREENKFTSFIESDDYLICCLRNVSPQFHAYNKNGNKEIDFDAIAVKLVTENIILISDFHDSYYYDLKKKEKIADDALYAGEIQVVFAYDTKDFEIRNPDGSVMKKNLRECGYRFSEGLMPIKDTDGKTGFINEKGNFVFECPIYGFHSIYDPKIHPLYDFEFSNGIVCVPESESSFALYTKDGRKLKTVRNSRTEQRKFTSGYMLISTVDKAQKQYAFLNYKGENAFNQFFSAAERFINEYAMVVVDGKDAVINTKGDVFFCADFVSE